MINPKPGQGSIRHIQARYRPTRGSVGITNLHVGHRHGAGVARYGAKLGNEWLVYPLKVLQGPSIGAVCPLEPLLRHRPEHIGAPNDQVRAL